MQSRQFAWQGAEKCAGTWLARCMISQETVKERSERERAVTTATNGAQRTLGNFCPSRKGAPLRPIARITEQLDIPPSPCSEQNTIETPDSPWAT